MIPPDADAALVADAQTGSAPAFARLVDAHQQVVRGFLRRLCGDWAEADDLAQETFVAAWTRLRSFRPDGTFRLWLYGIAYRKFLASRRATLRRRHRESSTATHAPPPAGLSAEDRIDVRKALMTLPDDQRAVVALCLAAGVSHGDAAALLGLPLGTVKSHAQRGRARLLSILDGRDD